MAWSRHLTSSVGQRVREDQKAARNPDNPLATTPKSSVLMRHRFNH